MRAFIDYGVMLINAISLEALGSTLLLPASIAKPPLPQKLEYTSAPMSSLVAVGSSAIIIRKAGEGESRAKARPSAS